jgi:hypothetical protein
MQERGATLRKTATRTKTVMTVGKKRRGDRHTSAYDLAAIKSRITGTSLRALASNNCLEKRAMMWVQNCK